MFLSSQKPISRESDGLVACPSCKWRPQGASASPFPSGAAKKQVSGDTNGIRFILLSSAPSCIKTCWNSECWRSDKLLLFVAEICGVKDCLKDIQIVFLAPWGPESLKGVVPKPRRIAVPRRNVSGAKGEQMKEMQQGGPGETMEHTEILIILARLARLHRMGLKWNMLLAKGMTSAPLRAFMHADIYIYTYIHIYIYIYINLYVCKYIPIYQSVNLSIYLSIRKSIDLSNYIYDHMLVRIDASLSVPLACICATLHLPVSARVSVYVCDSSGSVCVCVHVSVGVCTCVCVCVRVGARAQSR